MMTISTYTQTLARQKQRWRCLSERFSFSIRLGAKVKDSNYICRGGLPRSENVKREDFKQDGRREPGGAGPIERGKACFVTFGPKDSNYIFRVTPL